MEISFLSKQNSNKKQREEFLKKTPEERFHLFLKMIENYRIFKTNKKQNTSNTFLIE